MFIKTRHLISQTREISNRCLRRVASMKDSAPTSRRSTGFADDVEELFGPVGDDLGLPSRMALTSTRSVPTPRRACSGFDEIGAVFSETPPVGMILICGNGAFEILDIACTADRTARENLHKIGAGVPCGDDLGRRQHAGHHGHAFRFDTSRSFRDSVPG